jgi:hypothetical protein
MNNNTTITDHHLLILLLLTSSIYLSIYILSRTVTNVMSTMQYLQKRWSDDDVLDSRAVER